MPDVYTNFVSTGTLLINKYGRVVQLITPNQEGPAYDPYSRESASVDIKAVQTKYFIKEIDGILIRIGDIKFLIDSTEEITEKMRIKDGEDVYSIINVEPVKPGPTSVIYKVQARL